MWNAARRRTVAMESSLFGNSQLCFRTRHQASIFEFDKVTSVWARTSLISPDATSASTLAFRSSAPPSVESFGGAPAPMLEAAA
jgi:hypothetical protein